MMKIILILLTAAISFFPINTFGGCACGIPSTAKGDCLKGNCTNGKGVLIKPDGTRYEGEFKDELPDGKGIFIYPKMKVEKRGTYTFRHSGKYEGDVKKGLKEGQGTFVFITGTKYTGLFENDKMKKGVLTMSDGTIYEGEFDNDMPSGKGAITFSDGRKYIGEISHNKISGNGEMTFSDGKKEEGIFIDDKFVGKEPPGDKVIALQKDNSKTESNIKMINLQEDSISIKRIRSCAERVGIGTEQNTENYMKMTPEQFIEQMKKENRVIPIDEIEKKLGTTLNPKDLK